jgi:putative hydrolase
MRRSTGNSDTHVPGQLDRQRNGCERALGCGVPVDRVINTRTAVDLLAWRGELRG